MLQFVFCQGIADDYGELRREGFADAEVFHRFVTRLEVALRVPIRRRRP